MRDMERAKRAETIASMPEDERLKRDRAAWGAWLQRYGERLRREAAAGSRPEERVRVMNSTNPRSGHSHG
jgi:ABC-type phosphonate transport system ATPase subunit